MLARGGLNMKHWASNEPKVLEGLPPDAIHQQLQLDDGSTLKTLGVYWDAQADSITYTVKPVPSGERVTKRTIMSEVAKIYDPLGLLGPVIQTAKTIIQKLWKSSLSWDESIPSSIHTEWNAYCAELNQLNEISFPRKICPSKGKELQLHGFSDASEVGYGACIYIRSTDSQGIVHSTLFCAKSKVAPVKKVNIPRLELCEALLLSKLYQRVRSAREIPIKRTVFWSDSMITLYWIKKSTDSLKTFVGNQVSEIQTITQGCEWRHIPGVSNPADALSRGQSPSSFMSNELWKTGPSWLIEAEDNWPANPITEPVEDSEVKRVTVMRTSLIDTTLFEKYSSINKLKRIIAYLLRFKLSNTYKGPVQPEELIEAEKIIIKMVQRSTFPRELRDLQNKEPVGDKSKLQGLNLFRREHT
ncbi:uncharacterized protein LOC135169136 [Diachasmimorpha longicaudata]|uniref:uncharacterized protein LOC135169136 n=1 Tax=Diachasmimorpha longicaudata TaxID=58733 RepID=UPI0030B8C27F